MLSPDSSITGSAQTGFTSPTYSLEADSAPAPNTRQYVVTACGGTQTGARANTGGDPFTLSVKKSPYKALPQKTSNGTYGNVPMNRKELLVRKGLKIDADGTIKTGFRRTIWELPAGSEVNDAPGIRAMASFGIGAEVELSASIGDSLVADTW